MACGFWVSGRWDFYGFFEDFPKTQNNDRKTAKTAEVVGFGDKMFTLSIDRYFLKEGGIVKS